jgi:hypothetical protein
MTKVQKIEGDVLKEVNEFFNCNNVEAVCESIDDLMVAALDNGEFVQNPRLGQLYWTMHKLKKMLVSLESKLVS